MSDLKITGITVSVELKRSTYGGAEAENRFASMRAEIPVGAAGLDANQALSESLDLHFKTWESLLAAEVTMGGMDSPTFTARLERARRRLDKLKAFLQENPV